MPVFGRSPRSRGAVVVTDGSPSRFRTSANGCVGERLRERRHLWRRQCAAFSRKLPTLSGAVASCGVFDLVANSAALPMRLFERDRVAEGEHCRRERQRAWRPVTLERPDTASPQARRAAPAMRTLPQHPVRPEGSGRAPARRRRRARDRHTFISVEALVTGGAVDSGRGDRRSRSIALPCIADAKVEQGFRIVGRFPVPALPWSSAGNRQREPPGTVAASVSERGDRRLRRGRTRQVRKRGAQRRRCGCCRSTVSGQKGCGALSAMPEASARHAHSITSLKTFGTVAASVSERDDQRSRRGRAPRGPSAARSASDADADGAPRPA